MVCCDHLASEALTDVLFLELDVYSCDMAIVLLINFEYPRAPSFALNKVFFTWDGALRTREVVSVGGSKAWTRPAFGVTLMDIRISMAAR